MTNLPPYVILEKKVGETPLSCVEAWRAAHPVYEGVPLAYAGRLDPMASGLLLILIGDECKVQERYHALDKTYCFSVLFGVNSDSGDVLGLVREAGKKIVSEAELLETTKSFVGPINLPYPVFSAKTVAGKPLHTWAIEGRLAEITIPTKSSIIHSLELDTIQTYSRKELYEAVVHKIALLPTVTDPRKALGNDFRRSDVLGAWQKIKTTESIDDTFFVASFLCTASSGTYMRTLAEEIAKAVGSTGLAFSIHREAMGQYDPTQKIWTKLFTYSD